MIENSDFRFKENNSISLELPFSEHIDELRQRIFHVFCVMLVLTVLAFIEVKFLVQLLQVPIENVKFFQLSPSEYFISTVKLSVYTGILFGSPFLISQIILFLVPGLTKNETRIILPLLFGSLFLFGIGLVFSYYVLIPAALGFFLNYSKDIIEPLWSFDQYFEFIIVVFYTTGLAFQIPIIQIVLGYLNLISPTQMLNAWRYVIVIATIIGAILTPSTDPFTQLLLSSAILLLYFFGVGILLLIKN